MNREELKKLLPVLQAFAEGRVIQYSENGEWKDITTDEGLYVENAFINYDDYRIKPQPTYRPFKDAEECWQEMQKHQPFGWVKSTLHGDYTLVQRVTTLYVGINRDIIDYKDTMRDYTFADGQPFGVKEE